MFLGTPTNPQSINKPQKPVSKSGTSSEMGSSTPQNFENSITPYN